MAESKFPYGERKSRTYDFHDGSSLYVSNRGRKGYEWEYYAINGLTYSGRAIRRRKAGMKTPIWEFNVNRVNSGEYPDTVWHYSAFKDNAYTPAATIENRQLWKAVDELTDFCESFTPEPITERNIKGYVVGGTVALGIALITWLGLR